MDSKRKASIALLLSINLIFGALTTHASNNCNNHKKKSPPPPSRNHHATCPRNALKLGVCANLLRSLLGIVIGNPPKQPCCSLIQGLLDLEAAVCLCTAIRANLLGINLNVPLSISLLLNACGKKYPRGFTCPK